jgi:hypothetical protein
MAHDEAQVTMAPLAAAGRGSDCRQSRHSLLVGRGSDCRQSRHSLLVGGDR